MMPAARHLTLLSRAYCSLCDAMQQAAEPVARAHGAILEVRDIDALPTLEAIWGDMVPVLFLGDPEDGRKLCHYHFDAARVSEALARPPVA